MKRTTFEQFDAVNLITTKNVKWLNDHPGRMPDPDGVWSIVCTYPSSGELMLQKESALIRIPASDVRKIANYDVSKVFNKLDSISKKYNQKEDHGQRN
jgi:hypothetical protein